MRILACGNDSYAEQFWRETRVIRTNLDDKPGDHPGWPHYLGHPIPDGLPPNYEMRATLWRSLVVDVVATTDYDAYKNDDGVVSIRSAFSLISYDPNNPSKQTREKWPLRDLISFSISTSDQWDGDQTTIIGNHSVKRPSENLILANFVGGRARVTARDYGKQSDVAELRSLLERRFIHNPKIKKRLQDEAALYDRPSDHDPV